MTSKGRPKTKRQTEVCRTRVVEAHAEIAARFAASAEWFCTVDNGETHALLRSELEIAVAHGRLVLTAWTEKGTRSWRIFAWDLSGSKIVLSATRRFGAERPLIELVPRAAASAIALTVKTARQHRSKQLGMLACSIHPGTKLERASLSPGARRGQPGRYACIILAQRHQRIALTGSVASSKPGDADAFLSSALMWFKRTSERARAPYIQQLWLAVEASFLKPVVQRIALLRPSLRNAIAVYEVNQEFSEMTLAEVPTREDLWRRRLARFPPVPITDASEISAQLIKSAGAAVDVVSARHGETLRYFGLPFARVRRVLGTERLWFGVDGTRRRLLDQNSETEWANLLAMLIEQRSAAATDHRHALYRNAAEAWLESLLRRDITRLDPGLIIAPLHAQFRTARGGVLGVRPVDLLALRHDGRLVVIELKVAEAREHVLQGVDYWQRVEAHRRRGHITRAKLFGERKISNESPLVYLVAPTLRVHPSFNALARSIDGDIEIYRFDINEDWRAGVRVMRRLRVN